ncbi:MAG: PQQ-binding-like beta-propeller repeat protein [Planctomycetes bacterium]|nr:PQQ-binding-like beta-propeller repeat protein [Planctomycetota bacterium]
MKNIAALLFCLLLPAFAAAQSESDSVYFDEESDATTLVEKGDAALKKGDLPGAIAAWQKVLDDHPRAVMPAGDGIWLSASVAVSRRIAALPPEGIDEYVSLYESVASQRAAKGTFEDLRSAAEQFFCTPSGGEAMERLGAMYADTGAIEMAMRCWEEVAERHPAKKERPAMLARLGLAYQRLGFEEKAKALTAAHGGLAVMARGTLTTIADLMAKASSAPIAAGRTAAILPDLTFAPIPDSAPIPRSVKWRLELGQKNQVEARRGVVIRRGGVGQALQTYPSAADGKLFVNLGRCLIALDSATGEFQWRIGEPIGEVASGKPFVLPSTFFAYLDQRFWGHRFYAVISEGILYANLTTSGEWCQLRAIRVKDARSIGWGPEAGLAPGYDLTGPPLPWRDRVYVGGVDRNKPSEVWLFAFDKATGALVWKTFVAAYQPPGGGAWGGNAAMPVFAPVVAASGSYVYVCTNNGALACVSHTGEILWATKYPKPKNQNPWMWMQQAAEDTWDLSPIFATGRDIIFFPSDGTHCCRLDGITGRGFLAPSDPSKPVENPLRAMSVVARERCRHLIAIDGDLATLVGDECKLYDLRKGSMVSGAWDETKPWPYCGRGLVTRDSIFVPVRSTKPRILIFNRKMKEKKDVPWPTDGAPGTLMLAGKLLLSVSPHEIVALSDEAPPAPPDDPEDGEVKPGDGTKTPPDGEMPKPPGGDEKPDPDGSSTPEESAPPK